MALKTLSLYNDLYFSEVEEKDGQKSELIKAM